MSILSRLADALFAFRHGLPSEPERPEPIVASGEWFAAQHSDGRQPNSTAARMAAWLAMRRDNGVSMEESVFGPFKPLWQGTALDIKADDGP